MVDYAAIVYPGPLAKYGGVAALPGYPGSAELLTSEVEGVIRQRLRGVQSLEIPDERW